MIGPEEMGLESSVYVLNQAVCDGYETRLPKTFPGRDAWSRDRQAASFH
jgi:hypothetical protein